MTDVEVWQPKYLNLKIYYDVNGSKSVTGNLGGYFFYPLIVMDRQLIHRNINYFE